MSTIVVAKDHEERWALIHALALPVTCGMAPEPARAKLSHPSSPAPAAVLLVVRDEADLGWLFWYRARSTRPGVPVVALVDGEALLAPTVGAGASHAELLADDGAGLVHRLRDALDEAAAPTVVVTPTVETLAGRTG